MSDQDEPFGENVPGKYYIVKTCIGCTLCSEIAPDHFAESTDPDLSFGHNYVRRQPETEAEERLCREAMDVCPAGAIRNNGLSKRA